MLLPKIFVLFLIAILIFSAPALAHETSSENLESFVGLYNSVYEKAPSAFKTLVGTETIKVSYKLADGDEITFGVKTVDGKITESSATPYAGSTLAISVSEETLNRIANSADPLAEFKNAWSSEIKVEGLTFTNIIKVFIVNVIKIFTSFFSPAPVAQQTQIGIQGSVRIIGLPGYPYYNPAQYGGTHKNQHFAASEDIGKCGDWWNYTAVEGMSVVIKKNDGSFCEEVPVNICKKIAENSKLKTVGSQPYFKRENLPGEGVYLIGMNMPDGWGYFEEPSHKTPKASEFPIKMFIKRTGPDPNFFGFHITKGAPTPARIICEGGATTSSATTQPPTTTSTSSTTTSSSTTTTTSTPMPDLEITPADISDATYNSTSHLYKLNIVIKNIGSVDSGLFNTSLIAYNSSSFFLFNSLGRSYGYALDGDGNSPTFQINNIPAGGQITKTFLFNFYDQGSKKNFMLNFSADFQNQVIESNENNNFVSKNISVMSGGTTTTTTSSTTTTTIPPTTTTLQQLILTIQTGGSVNYVSWSPDGSKIASAQGYNDKTVKIWDSSTGSLIKTLTGPTTSVSSVSWSPDGTKIAAGSNEVRIWDNNGNLIRTISGVSASSVEWSPDSSLLVYGGTGSNSAYIINVSTGSTLRTLSGHSNYILSVSWSLDGSKIASGSSDDKIKIWNASTGTLLKDLSGHTGDVEGVSWDKYSAKVASSSGNDDRSVMIWSVSAGTEIKKMVGHTAQVTDVDWSPDGIKVVSAGGPTDKTVRVWDTSSGNLLKTLSGHTDTVQSAQWSPDGMKIASGSLDKTIRIWLA